MKNSNWRFKKGDKVIVKLPAIIKSIWGTDAKPLYQLTIKLKDGTFPGVKEINIDVKEKQVRKRKKKK